MEFNLESISLEERKELERNVFMGTLEQLKAYCREQFTGYKKPKYIEFRQDLPKSNVGKILRRALREEQTEQASQVA